MKFLLRNFLEHPQAYIVVDIDSDISNFYKLQRENLSMYKFELERIKNIILEVANKYMDQIIIFNGMSCNSSIHVTEVKHYHITDIHGNIEHKLSIWYNNPKTGNQQNTSCSVIKVPKWKEDLYSKPFDYYCR